ncbi:DUF6069 family protein [Agromyces laixinhei]|uniref:DUF6069 family protein n=1 Tax=Agromyces laixinhei TaxID=2585717 RepID=UPI0011175EFF|nr:DUF6069 family protein [Agromyces laixinhei]
MSSTIDITAEKSRATRIRYRVLTAVVAVVAPLAVWIVASLAGASLAITSPLVGTLQISALLVIVSTLPLALAAWGVLALLERLTSNARRAWTIISVAVLVFSLPPLVFLDATLGTKVALGCMHLAAGIVLIFMLRRRAAGA